MAIEGKGSGFNVQSLVDVPEQPGVFELSQYNIVTFIGSTSTSIRDALMHHFEGEEGFCTVSSTWVKFELVPSERAEAYATELLEAHRAAHGQLPRCNDLSSWEPAGPSGVRGE